MPPRVRLLFSAIMVPLFIMAAVPIYTELSRRSDIWWTPRAMLVPLAESAGRVEIYLRGRPLAGLLESGQIRIAAGAQSRVLTSSEVGLRFNNWDRIRAERLPSLLVSAAGCGILALMFLLLVTGRLAYREEKGQTS